MGLERIKLAWAWNSSILCEGRSCHGNINGASQNLFCATSLVVVSRSTEGEQRFYSTSPCQRKICGIFFPLSRLRASFTCEGLVILFVIAIHFCKETAERYGVGSKSSIQTSFEALAFPSISPIPSSSLCSYSLKSKVVVAPVSFGSVEIFEDRMNPA